MNCTPEAMTIAMYKTTTSMTIAMSPAEALAATRAAIKPMPVASATATEPVNWRLISESLAVSSVTALRKSLRTFSVSRPVSAKAI